MRNLIPWRKFLPFFLLSQHCFLFSESFCDGTIVLPRSIAVAFLNDDIVKISAEFFSMLHLYCTRSSFLLPN
jgi:hypothetical protein